VPARATATKARSSATSAQGAGGVWAVGAPPTRRLDCETGFIGFKVS
jgi:hypothetical protein